MSALHLPDEILEQMLSYLPEGEESRSTFWSCCLVSRQWHNLTVARLYAAPLLTGWRYDLFVRTICPSLNTHVRKSDLAGLVQKLDMSKLAYQGSKSITARVLARTKPNLRSFSAPQAHWGVNCLAALRKCVKMQHLDLSLLSEAMSWRELSDVIQNMPDLQKLRFPRSAAKDDPQFKCEHIQWPSCLEDLTLSGNLSRFVSSRDWSKTGALTDPANLPNSLRKLSVAHAEIDDLVFWPLLSSVGENLTELRLSSLRQSPLHLAQDEELGQAAILRDCPHLKTLALDANWLREDLVYGLLVNEIPHFVMSHPLKYLYVGLPSRYDRFDTESLLAGENLMEALESRVLPSLQNVIYEVLFSEPKQWDRFILGVHRYLKRRALANGIDAQDAGVRYAILEG